MKPQNLATCLVASVAAAESGLGPGPHQRAEVFIAANQSPNATGMGMLQGIDMTFPPSQVFTAPWIVSVNVTEVPGVAPDHQSDVQANSVISFNAQGNFLSNNTQWSMCAMIMQTLSLEATVDESSNSKDGLCTATLGENCREDWLQALRSSRASAASNSRLADTTTPCGDISQETAGGQASYYDTSDFYTPSNSSAEGVYDSAVTKIWPVILISGLNGTFNDGAGSTLANIACIKANMTRNGSRDVGDVPGRAEGRTSGSFVAIVGVFTSVALFM